MRRELASINAVLQEESRYRRITVDELGPAAELARSQREAFDRATGLPLSATSPSSCNTFAAASIAPAGVRW